MNSRVFGGKCTESLASYDPDTRSWKTSQISLFEDSIELSDRWPTSGMTRSGTLYPLPTWVRPIAVKEFGLWPTPTVSYGRNATSGRKPDSKHHSGTTLYDIAYQEGGKLNPNWVEWLMGYPPGWTDLED